MKFNSIKKIAGALFLTLCWWTLLYPQLTFSEDTCNMIFRTKEGEEIELSLEKEEDFYRALLSAEPKQIRIRSKLFEELFE